MRHMDNQIDAAKGLADRDSVRVLITAQRIVSVGLSPLITPFCLVTVISQSMSINIEKDVVVLTVREIA